MRTRLARAVQDGRFAITAELVPPLTADRDELLAAAAPIADLVHAINVTDGAGAKTGISSFAAAAILSGAGIEPVVQVTCRDRNRIALTADLLGASAQGVHNLLILRGDDPAGGDQPEAKAVFDLDSASLMQIARDMRDAARLPSGRALATAPYFFIGGADVPQDPAPDWQPSGLLAKIAAGAQFVQTQFCFEPEVARRYLSRLTAAGIPDRLAVLLGVGPIASARSARWMHDHLFGVHIPPSVISRLEHAADPAAEGIDICAELIAAYRDIPGVAGVHIMAPGGGTEAIAEVLKRTPSI